MEVPRPLKVILVRKCSSEWTNSKIEEIDKILSVRFQVKFTEIFENLQDDRPPLSDGECRPFGTIRHTQFSSQSSRPGHSSRTSAP